MPSKKSKRELGRLEGVHEALTSVALVLEAGEVLHSDHAADQHAQPEDVVEDEVLNGILLFLFFAHIDLQP